MILNFHISDTLNQRLEEYRNKQDIKPAKAEVIRTAITKYLNAEV